MEWQKIKEIHFNQDVEKIISELTCDNCQCSEGLFFSESSATILCETCKEFIIRISMSRNARLIKIAKMHKGVQ